MSLASSTSTSSPSSSRASSSRVSSREACAWYACSSSSDAWDAGATPVAFEEVESDNLCLRGKSGDNGNTWCSTACWSLERAAVGRANHGAMAAPTASGQSSVRLVCRQGPYTETRLGNRHSIDMAMRTFLLRRCSGAPNTGRRSGRETSTGQARTWCPPEPVLLGFQPVDIAAAGIAAAGTAAAGIAVRTWLADTGTWLAPGGSAVPVHFHHSLTKPNSPWRRRQQT